MPERGSGLYQQPRNRRLRIAARRLDVLAFDACYMGNLEAVATLAAQAGVCVVTEGRAPGQGFPYGRILAHLRENPAQSPEELANFIVEANQSVYGADDAPVTQSALCSDALGPVVGAFTTLIQQLDLADAATFEAVQAAMENSAALGGTGNIDLKDFATELINHPIPIPVREAAQLFLNQLPTLKPGAGSPVAARGTGGLSIYGPNATDFDTEYLRLSAQLPLNLGVWSWFLGDYYLRLLGSKASGNALIQAIQRTMDDLIRRGIYKPRGR